MVFLATNITPTRSYQLIKNMGASLKNYSIGRINKFATGGDTGLLLECEETLNDHRGQLLELIVADRIVQEARDEEANGAYNLDNEVDDLVAFIDVSTAEITLVIPIDGEGNQVIDTFTNAQLTDLIADLQAIVDGID